MSPSSLAKIKVTLIMFGLMVCASSSRSEIIQGHMLGVKGEDPNAPAKVFSSSDFLRVCLDPMPKTRFIVGEPVPLNFRLVNHTKNVFIVNLNLDLRDGLNIQIQDRKSPGRRYNGPFEPGTYPPFEMRMYPFEERPFQIIIWGDRDTASGMAFPDPGQYAIRFTVRAYVPSQGLSADMPPLDPITLAPAKPIFIEVLPPSPEVAPLVNELKASKAFPDIHMRRIPGNDLEKFVKYVEQFPATPLTPYLTFMLGIHYNYLAMMTPADEELKKTTSKYYQMTALADSEITAEAWEALLRLYDGWGLAEPAREAALKMIEKSPSQIAPMLGSMDLVKKYLPNSVEMAPDRYWDLLN